MDYRNHLIQQKKYFGLVWLAAHKPSKLSKAEIIHIDLSKKCNDLVGYIASAKKSAKPSISLLISSHLMKGLATILLKKNKYLYDELEHLRIQISRSYTLIEPKRAKATKIVKKMKETDKSAITLVETFPDIMNMSSIESMVQVMDNTVLAYQHKNITLPDTDDFINRSALIPVDNDFIIESEFGEADQNMFAMPMVDDYTLARMEHDEHVDTMLEISGIPKPAVTSTVLKPAGKSRVPFADITDINNRSGEQAREDISVQNDRNLQTALFVGDDTNKPFDMDLFRLESNAIPALFEQTVLEHNRLPEMAQQAPLLDNVFIEDVSEEPVQDIITFSPDITTLKENMAKKKQMQINRKRKNLIIDTNIELVIEQSEKLKRMNKPFRPGTEEYMKQIMERELMFREQNPWLLTRNDYFGIDLLKEPSSKIARRTKLTLNRKQAEFSVNFSSFKTFRSLTTGRQVDDTYFYLTQSKEGVECAHIGMIDNIEMSATEHMRREISEQRLGVSKGDESRIKKNKRSSSIISNHERQQSQSVFIDKIEHTETLEPVAFESLLMERDSTMPALDNFMEGNIESTGYAEDQAQKRVELVEVDNYEITLIEALDSAGSILQAIIHESDIPEGCAKMQMPRKYFAAKMFSAALSLAANKSVTLEQKVPYGPILVKMIE